MPWLTNFLQPTQSFLVAFDIASSSQNYLNPNGLQRDRQGLFQAIDQTRLVRRCVAHDAVGGQFLGDEFRLAFPVNGNHGAISATDVVEFVDEVFSSLESASIGYAPVVRAIMAKGPVEARELGGFGYLMGGVPFETLSKLSKAVGKQVNILVSDENLRPMLQSEWIGGLDLYVKRYASRRIPDPFPGPPHNDACTDCIVISVTNAKHQSDEGLINIARYVLNSLSSTLSNLKVTIGPTSIVFAIPEAQFNQSKKLLAEVQQCAINYGQSIAAAIGSGLGRVIPGSGWTTESFESGTAIELCRITSELAPGTLAIPDRQSVIELLDPLSRSLTEKVRIRGKRDEVFDALVSDGYFGKYEGTTTSSAASSAVSSAASSSASSAVPAVQSPAPATSPVGPVVAPGVRSVLSAQEWKQLEGLVPRIFLSDSSKTVLMIRIAKAADSDPANSPWADLAAIHGKIEFFTTLFHTLETYGNPSLDEALVQGLLALVINASDNEFLKRLSRR
jgi:hypothetical protein